MNDQPDNANRKSVVYARCSTAGGQALEEQTEAGLALAAERGTSECQVVAEHGYGVKVNSRLQELLDRMEAGEKSHTAALDPERMKRNKKGE